MHQVLCFWLDRGVDRFRIDVIHRMLKDSELRDNDADVAHLRRDLGEHVRPLRNMDHPDNHDVVRGFRRTVATYGDRRRMRIRHRCSASSGG